MENLKYIKQALVNCAQGQVGDLASVDAKEMGEVIDMIKDLSEAMYYCAIVKSMEETEQEQYYPMNYRDMDRNSGKMYYPQDYNRYYPDGNRQMPGESRNYPYPMREYPIELRDYKEGQSPLTRKTYMERKMHGGDKMVQMQELEKYMLELGRDLSEMIEGSSPEEKQMLQKKLAALATKIA